MHYGNLTYHLKLSEVPQATVTCTLVIKLVYYSFHSHHVQHLYSCIPQSLLWLCPLITGIILLDGHSLQSPLSISSPHCLQLLWLPDLCLSYFQVVYFHEFILSFFIVSKWLFSKPQMSLDHISGLLVILILYLLNCFWQWLHKDTFSSLLRFLQSLGVPLHSVRVLPLTSTCSNAILMEMIPISFHS